MSGDEDDSVDTRYHYAHAATLSTGKAPQWAANAAVDRTAGLSRIGVWGTCFTHARAPAYLPRLVHVW